MTHPSLVATLCKPGKDIVLGMNARGGHLMHMAIGVSGEAGELLDTIKRHVIYQQEIDMVNAVEEIGDIEFYLEGLRQGLGVTRDECLRANIAKLQKRYGEKYSNEAAKERRDKVA